MENPHIIVLTRNYSTGLSVVRSLGAAGYTVDLVASAPKEGASAVVASSKYVRNVIEVVHKKVKEGQGEAFDQLMEALLECAGKSEAKPVLFPTDDYTASVMDQNRSQLEPYFLMPSIVGGGDGSLTQRMDKTLQAEMARKVGLRVPKEWIFSLKEELVIPADMVYPCFCKPIESVTGYKKEMAACEDEAELVNHLKKLRDRFADRSILVQEFLHIDNEIDLSGVCLDQEIIIPAIIQKTRVAQHEKGVTLAGKLVPVETLGEIQEKIVALLKQFRYVGMFDMELNVVGNKIYFNEVNLRSGGPNYSYFMSGVNLPALFVKEVLGEGHTPEEEQVDAYGKSFVYEKVAWEDYIHGYLTKKELDETIQNADITLLYSKDDPAPETLFLKRIKRQVLKHKLKQIKHAIKEIVMPPLRLLKPYILQYPQTKKKNRRDPNSERPRVIVSGRNYASNLCLARSFGEAGYEVEILRIFQKGPGLKQIMRQLQPDAYSKYIKAYHVCVTKRQGIMLVKKLKELADPGRKMLLIPADDLVASIADEYYDDLKDLYAMPNIEGRSGAINRLMSKEIQMELAKAAGLPVINSCVICSSNGRFEIPDAVQYPCFIKPNISKNSSKSKMQRCDSKEELHAALTQLAKNKNFEMMVEDFVDIRKEYAILGLSTKDGVIAPGFFGTEEGGHDARRGVAMVGKVLPCSQQQKLIDDIVKFIETLHYEGLFDVDLIETTDGKLYFVELNLRYGASGYAITKSGANLPGMFADYMLLHKSVDMSCKVEQPGKTFISERVMLGEFMDDFLSFADVKRWMNTVDIHFIKNEEDPKAYRHFKKYLTLTRILKPYILYKKQKKKAALAAVSEE